MASLERLWKEGRDGALSPLEQMRAWALRTAQRDLGGDKAVNLEKIADQVTKVGGGHPTREAIRRFLDRVDEDPEWYPGKTYRKRPGPQAVLHGKKRKQVAKSAMNLKKEGAEPTYAAIAARCPAAVVNPDTGKPVDKKLVYTVLKTDCYDRNPEDPWVCKPVYTRRFLPDDLMEQRLHWAKRLLQEGYTGGWFYRHVVWVDLCHTIIPGDEKKALAQTLARKNHSRWYSRDAKGDNCNLSAPKHALTQCAFRDEKVWWGFVMLRGKVHVEVFDDDFPGENSKGAKILGQKLEGIVALRTPRSSLQKPKVVFSDRGRGFYNPQGYITKKWADALQEGGIYNVSYLSEATLCESTTASV